MTTKQKAVSTASMEPDGLASLIEQYGCGPVEFAGTDEALYERHLLFDNVVKLTAAGPRERFEAVARSVRDVLSQRWLLTEDTYERENPKRVYYLSMEFLIGRCLANNVTNLLLDAIARQAVKQKNLDWLGMLEAEPDAGLGNGGLGRLAACFLDSMATMQLPAMGYGLRYEYGIFRQTIQDGWQHEQPDNWLRRPDPWEVISAVRESGSQAWLLIRGARRRPATHPRKDRHAVWHPLRPPRGRLRRQDDQHASALGRRSPGLLRFPEIQRRRFCRRARRDAHGRVAHAGTVSR